MWLIKAMPKQFSEYRVSFFPEITYVSGWKKHEGRLYFDYLN